MSDDRIARAIGNAEIAKVQGKHYASAQLYAWAIKEVAQGTPYEAGLSNTVDQVLEGGKDARSIRRQLYNLWGAATFLVRRKGS